MVNQKCYGHEVDAREYEPVQVYCRKLVRNRLRSAIKNRDKYGESGKLKEYFVKYKNAIK